MSDGHRTIGSSNTKFVVQDTWNEEDDQELRDYLEEQSNDLSYLSKEDILMLPQPSPDTVLFADSSLVQTILQTENRKDVIIDSYPDAFQHLYKRKIIKTALAAASIATDFPYFVKLQGSNKDFTARIVHSKEDHDGLVEEIGIHTPVYVCDVVDYVAEYRLFLTANDLVAICEYSEYMIGHRLQNHHYNDQSPLVVENVQEVPRDFLNQVLRAHGTLNTCCVVDVGLSSDGKWSVVECNPPFSLSSYGLDMKTYVDYCTHAWKQLWNEKERIDDVRSNISDGSTE